LDIKSIILSISVILLNTVFGYGQVPDQLDPACADSVEIYSVKGSPGSLFIWDIEEGKIVSPDLLNDTVKIRWNTTNGASKTRKITVTESTVGGCSDIRLAQLVVRGPYVELGYEYPEICMGDSIIFNIGNNFQLPAEITWSDKSFNGKYEYIAKSTQKIKVQVIDGFGCGRSDSVFLTVNKLPVVNLGKDTVLCDEQNPLTIYYNQIMDKPSEFSSAVWKLGSKESYDNFITIPAFNEDIDTLVATITNIKNCVSTDTMLFLTCDVTELFKNMPNSITPNGDGQNDVWNIPYMNLNVFQNAVLEIFDRWGRLVYRTDKVNEEPWDGKSKGRALPMDSYYYVLKLNFQNAQITGTVNLIK
jgi:gliding motility-associated-like protein